MAPTLSLCMIVKNEEDNLANCLSSAAKYVNEIIVVDTGSTDKTREVATRFGASVFTFDNRTNPESFFMDDEATCSQFGSPGPYSGEIAFGDFSAARNESFRHATGDYILWVDADDVVEGAENLPQIVSDLATRNLPFGFLAYDYARDHLGRVFYRQWRERIIKRGSARWVNPVHEVLLPYGTVAPVRYEQVKLVHHRKADRPGTPNRNYKLLLRHLQQVKTANPDAPVDPRTWFYLGQEARFIEPLKAVGFYEEYLKNSGWPEERAAAHVALGSMHEFGMLGLKQDVGLAKADMHFATAAAEMPDNPDGLFGLARVAYMRGRWADCVNYTERGLRIGNTDSMLGANPMDRLYRPHVYYNHALAQLGRVEEAIVSCKAALAICPDDPGVPGGASGMLAFNLKVYEQQQLRGAEVKPQTGTGSLIEFDRNEDLDAPPAEGIPRDAMVIWAMQLWKQCVKLGDAVRSRGILEMLPPAVAADPVVARMKEATEKRFPAKQDMYFERLKAREEANQAEASRKLRDEYMAAKDALSPASRKSLANVITGDPGALSVVIWTGPAFQPWDPTTPNTTGIGGSETACIEVAKNLAKLGHSVMVYGDCAQTARVYDGVTYRHYETFQGVECDVFISSRSPAIMEYQDRIRAKLKLLWVHDIHVGPPGANLERWLLRFDRILCLSEWHKGYFLSVYPTVHEDTVIVTRNGIDPGRFENEVLKEDRLVFSSSPNRGLDTLLKLFPQIRARVPNAHLDIYYGFDCWETFAKNNPAEMQQINGYKEMIRKAEDLGGVKWHGRVNQKTLAEAFMRAKIHAYPTNFPETSCISAMEAQAAGCLPVTTRYAALAETVKNGILINPGPQYEAEWLTGCIELLTKEELRAPLAAEARRYALANLSWAGLAKDWQEMFRRLIAEVKANPVAAWRAA